MSQTTKVSSSIFVSIATVKSLKTFSFFLAYDVLKIIKLPQLLFGVMALSSIFFLILQRPFKSKVYTTAQFRSVAVHAIISTLLLILWTFSFTLCGPLRAVLISELNEVVLLTAINAMFSATSSSKSKSRGIICLLLGLLTLLFFDNDNADKLPKHPEGHHTNHFTHVIYSVFLLTGMSDHKIGIILMSITALLYVVFRSYEKKLILDIGGPKSLHALSTAMSAGFLFPFFCFSWGSEQKHDFTFVHMVFLLFIIALLSFVIPFYVESYVAKLDPAQSNLFGSVFSIVCAVCVGLIWTRPYIASVEAMTQFQNLTEDHLVSIGVIIAAALFITASFVLSAPGKSPCRGSFIGYNTDGQPIYSYANQAFTRTTTSVRTIIRNGLQQIISEKDSRQIFYFLCVNLGFTFVELIYGAWTNSLGLISDGFHMLFDCSALCLGLFAAVMSKWKANSEYPYGYGRIEVLSGFVNALFLAVIAFFVLTEALERLFDPPTVSTDRLLFVSVAGLLVNLFGIFAFHEAHHHAHGGGCSHGHDSKSSHSGHNHGLDHGHHHHGDSSCGGGHVHHHDHAHSHDHSSHDHGSSAATNTNMKGVFLHVLADTLGSCGVIVSSLLIQYFGWNIADPICSLFIAVLIGLSIVPLLTETAKILLNCVPSEMQADLNASLMKIQQLEGVIGYRDTHFWRHSSSLVCATLHVQVDSSAIEQRIIQHVSAILKSAGVGDIAVQVEKEEFFHHMSGLNNQVINSGCWPTSSSPPKVNRTLNSL